MAYLNNVIHKGPALDNTTLKFASFSSGPICIKEI